MDYGDITVATSPPCHVIMILLHQLMQQIHTTRSICLLFIVSYATLSKYNLSAILQISFSLRHSHLKMKVVAGGSSVRLKQL